MKFQRQRYQTGSVRKVSRSHGSAWEFRYYATDPDGVRKLKVQTFNASIYRTERDVRKAVEGQLAALNANTLAGKVNLTFGQLIDRYLQEELPTLKHSTQMTNKSLIQLHLRPKWEKHRLSEITALNVKQWIDALSFGPASKVRARNIISRLLDLAMLWEYMPVQRNPMELVKIKGSTKRQKAITILTPAQFKALVIQLPEPLASWYCSVERLALGSQKHWLSSGQISTLKRELSPSTESLLMARFRSPRSRMHLQLCSLFTMVSSRC